MMENKNNPLPTEHDIEYAANLVSGEYTTGLVNELASYIDDNADLKSILDTVKMSYKRFSLFRYYSEQNSKIEYLGIIAS